MILKPAKVWRCGAALYHSVEEEACAEATCAKAGAEAKARVKAKARTEANTAGIPAS